MKRIAFLIILAGGAVALAASQFAADSSHVAPQPLATAHGNTGQEYDTQDHDPAGSTEWKTALLQ